MSAWSAVGVGEIGADVGMKIGVRVGSGVGTGTISVDDPSLELAQAPVRSASNTTNTKGRTARVMSERLVVNKSVSVAALHHCRQLQRQLRSAQVLDEIGDQELEHLATFESRGPGGIAQNPVWRNAGNAARLHLGQ